MVLPLTVSENVPGLDVCPCKTKVIVIESRDPDIVPPPDPENGRPSGLRPVNEALTFVPFWRNVIRQLFPLAHDPQYVPDTDAACCALTPWFAISTSIVPQRVDSRGKYICSSLSPILDYSTRSRLV
jgi:hypothetical protein